MAAMQKRMNITTAMTPGEERRLESEQLSDTNNNSIQQASEFF